jgi:hypothetical protein
MPKGAGKAFFHASFGTVLKELLGLLPAPETPFSRPDHLRNPPSASLEGRICDIMNLREGGKR